MNIGFLTENIGATQSSYYMIGFANKAVEHGLSPVIFQRTLHQPCQQLLCPCMFMNDAWAYDGVMVATSIGCISQLLQFPSSNKKYYYVWDIGTNNLKGKVFGPLSKIIANPEVELICRCSDHKLMIENNYNVSVKHVVENFQFEELLTILKQ